MTNKPLSSCVLIIGNEILSGRTTDANLNYLATRLGERGLPVREARVIPDVEEVIVATVNACRTVHDLVFTTGGIGATHDDITAASVAKAFGVPVVRHPEALRRLESYYSQFPGGMNRARARMADVPEGATLLENPISTAPGFRLGNVYVLAGVPRIMQGMFDVLLPDLPQGPPVRMRTVTAAVREGDIADELALIQAHYPTLDIGSYPFLQNGTPHTSLVAKGTDATALESATAALAALVQRIGSVPEIS